MNRFALMCVGVLALAISLGGCCDQQEKQIAQLKTDKASLETQLKGLQGELSQSRDRESSLLGQLSQKDSEINSLKSELEAARKGKATGPSRVVTPAPGTEVMVSSAVVEGDVLFSPGKAELTEAGKAELRKVIRDVKTQAADTIVRVYGHTDSDPIVKSKKFWEDNLDLSANRAMVVTRYMISNGVDASRMETVAMGEFHPADPGNSAASKKKNRRVEIVVLKKG